MPSAFQLPVQYSSEALTFSSVETLTAFVDYETKIWVSLADEIRSTAKQLAYQIGLPFDEVASRWKQIATKRHLRADGSPGNVDDDGIQVLRSYLADRKIEPSTSPAGAAMIAIAHDHPSEAGLLLTIILNGPAIGQSLINYGGQPVGVALRALIDSMPLIAQGSDIERVQRSAGEAAASAEAAARATDDFKRNALQFGQEFESEVAVFRDRMRGDLAKSLKGALRKSSEQRAEQRHEWGALKRTYDLKLKTKAPFIYWRGKERFHRRIARSWLVSLGWILAVTIIVIWVSAAIFGSSSSNGPLPWLTVAATVGVPAFVGLWLARIANRQYSSQLLRAEDARERSVFVRTLLALSKDDTSQSVVTDAQIAAMISSIFRPGPGFGSDDSPSVSFLENVLRALRGETH